MPRTRALPATLLLAAAALAQPPPPPAVPPPRITGFRLYNTDARLFMRDLRPNAVVAPPYNYTVVAVVSYPDPASVTFTRPFRHTERRPPFVLSGDWPPHSPYGPVNYQPLRLLPAVYRLSAFADNATEFEFTISNITFLPPTGLPARLGPLPTEIEPKLDLAKTKAPVKPPACESAAPKTPRLVVRSWGRTWYPGVEVGYILYYCKGPKLRERLIEYIATKRPDGTFEERTRVVYALVSKSYEAAQSIAHGLTHQFCEEKTVYLEFCAADAETKLEKCATSPIITLPAKTVPDPQPRFRPPIELVLAPGDRAKVRFAIANWTKDDEDAPFWNGQTNTNVTYVLNGAVERPGGFVDVGPRIRGMQAEVQVPVRGGGVTLADNGSQAYLQYAEADCPSNVAEFRLPYSTRIVVDPDAKALLRQDMALPEIVKAPTYPATEYKKPVTLSVEARNVGGGMRAGGEATGLTYQWYKREDMYLSFSRAYPRLIPGATGPMLRIVEAVCDPGEAGCGRWGCFGLERYYVDVCNTFGCRRAGPVLPNVLAPPGKSLEDIGCSFPFFL